MCVYKYSVDIILIVYDKIRIRWCTCSLWRMLYPNTRKVEFTFLVMGIANEIHLAQTANYRLEVLTPYLFSYMQVDRSPKLYRRCFQPYLF